MTATRARDDTSAQLRLAEILAPLSLVTDLGMGHPDEQAMRSCLVATGLARAMGADEATVHDVYYATLLEHLGCTATAVEEARHAAGDHLAARPLYSHTDFVRVPEMLGLLRQVGTGRGPIERGRSIAGAVAGFRWGPPVQAAVCEVAARLAGRLAMPVAVQEALGQMFERWDGKGEPRHLRGEAIALPARVANVASRAAALHAIDGSEAAIEGVRASRGGWLDPAIADCFLDHATDLLAAGDSMDALTATLEAEPQPWRTIPRQDLDDMARAFGDMVDLLSPHTLGHSSGVAELAEQAADTLGLSMAECVTLRRAALLHDLGRLGVPAGIWEKAGALGAAEWERVRLHAYYTERILTRSPLLVSEARIAGMHHERIDGSGYHRGSSAREQPLAARILAAADAYQAMRRQRAHRPALDAERAADELSREARAGRLDAEVVAAVLRADGVERAVDRRELPAGLSGREAEVLRLVAAGCSNREIADRLVISRRTAEHHVQHVYAKIGLSTRAGATLFALEHGLVPTHS